MHVQYSYEGAEDLSGHPIARQMDSAIQNAANAWYYMCTVHAIERLLESAQPSKTSATDTALLKLDDFHLHWWIRRRHDPATTESQEPTLLQETTMDYPLSTNIQRTSSIQVGDLQNLRQVYHAAIFH